MLGNPRAGRSPKVDLKNLAKYSRKILGLNFFCKNLVPTDRSAYISKVKDQVSRGGVRWLM